LNVAGTFDARAAAIATQALILRYLDRNYLPLISSHWQRDLNETASGKPGGG